MCTKKILDEELLKALYHKNNFTTQEIGNMLHCSRTTVTHYLNLYDIPIKVKALRRRKNAHKNKIKDKTHLEDLYTNQKLSSLKIAIILNISKPTILSYLRYYSIPIRHGSEAQIKNNEISDKVDNKKWLEIEYLNKKKSSLLIARELGTNSALIVRRLHQFDIPIRASGPIKGTWHYTEDMMKKWISKNRLKPNKKELELSSFLNEILPNKFKYVGDGNFILGGRCPDYLNTNGQKKLIELYGDFWHKGEDGIERIEYFKSFGFDTLIVWEHELKNKDLLSERIISFDKR